MSLSVAIPIAVKVCVPVPAEVKLITEPVPGYSLIVVT
jgi:hypothetical protein